MDPSLHTAGHQYVPRKHAPYIPTEPTAVPKFHQGDSTNHPGCRSPQATGTTPTPADTAEGPFTAHCWAPIRTKKIRPLPTNRSCEGPRNSTRETPLVTLDADHLKPQWPHPLQRIQHRDPSLHTAGHQYVLRKHAPYQPTEASRDPEIPPGRLH